LPAPLGLKVQVWADSAKIRRRALSATIHVHNDRVKIQWYVGSAKMHMQISQAQVE